MEFEDSAPAVAEMEYDMAFNLLAEMDAGMASGVVSLMDAWRDLGVFEVDNLTNKGCAILVGPFLCIVLPRYGRCLFGWLDFRISKVSLFSV